MKIIVDNTGQTCNKFWALIHPVLYAHKNHGRIFILSIEKEFHKFPNLKEIPNCIWLKKPTKKINKKDIIIRKCINRLFHNKYISQSKILTKYIWYGFKSKESLLEHNDIEIIKEYFKPSECIEIYIEKIFQFEKKDFDIVVGLHIRRKDYKYWRNGDFFYSNEEYLQFIKKIETYFDGKRIKFFIASDEDIMHDVFKTSSYFTIGKDAIHDLYGLAACDYIAGPPSSFSSWAALYGRKPLWQIIKGKEIEFKLINSLISIKNT